MSDRNTEQLIKDWILFHRLSSDEQEVSSLRFSEYEISKLSRVEPERCMQIIVGILQSDPSDVNIHSLAAGPLEDLFLEHGSDGVKIFENQMRKFPQIRILLKGVWDDDFDPEVKAWLRKNQYSV